MERKRKSKGGAGKLREKKKLLLASDAEMCSKLTDLFKVSEPSPAQWAAIKEKRPEETQSSGIARPSITYTCKEEQEETKISKIARPSITYTCKEQEKTKISRIAQPSITYTCKEEQEETKISRIARPSITYACKEQEETKISRIARPSITYACKEQEETKISRIARPITYTCKEEQEETEISRIARPSITYTCKEQEETKISRIARPPITYTCKEQEETKISSIARPSITYTCKEEQETEVSSIARPSITYTCKEQEETKISSIAQPSITYTCKEPESSNLEHPSTAYISKKEQEETKISSAERPSITYACKEKRPEDTEISNIEATTTKWAEPGLTEVSSAKWQTKKAINFFVRPKKNEIAFFFQSHPIQPFEDPSLPFAPKNVFLRKNGSRRQWVSYNKSVNALYCAVCLAYRKTNERSVFVEGMREWSHATQRVNEHETSRRHNSCVEIHMQALKQKGIGELLFSEQQQQKREKIENNRAVMEKVVEVIKLVGKRGRSYRAGASEAAYTLCDSLLDHGNFFEFLTLLSDYDPMLKSHLEKCQPAHESGSTGRESALPFLSKTTITNVIHVIASLIKKSIADEVKEAGMFSVQLDTTQDISAKDQCSVIIRYAGKLKGAQERLLAVVSGADVMRRGSLKLLKEALRASGLDVSQCVGIATDGAANLQAVYNKFSAWLSDKSPEQAHVWCYSHPLNLWITDVTRSPIAAASLFYLLKTVAVFFRESYKRKRNADQPCRLQTIGETPWWAEDAILTKIFGSFEDPSSSLYVDVILSLDAMEESEKYPSETRAKAGSYKEGLLRYETVMTAFIYLHIFQLTGPLSKYLQTVGVDLRKAHEMAMSALEQLEKMQRDVEEVKSKADDFIEWAAEELDKRSPTHDILIQDFFPVKAVRKRTPGEAVSEEPTADAYKDFEVDVHNRIFDTAVERLKARFEKNEMLYCNLAFLSPARFGEIKTSHPRNSLEKLSEALATFDATVTSEQLQSELVSLAKNWDRLKRSLPEEYILNNLQEKSEDPDVIIIENCEKPSVRKRCQNCAVCVYLTLERYNLFTGAYHNIGLAYRYLLTLPAAHVACEGSISVLRYIKDRLRSAPSAEYAEAVLLMAAEKDVLQRIEPDVIMANVAIKSAQLHKELYLQ